MGIRGIDRISKYNFKNRNAVLFSVLALALIFSVSSILLQPSFQDEIPPGYSKVPVPIVGFGKYYNDWAIYGSSLTNKATVVTDSTTDTGINRVSNAKFQTFSVGAVDPLTIPAGASNFKVLVEVIGKTSSGTTGLNIMSITGTKNSDWNFGTQTYSFSTTAFVSQSRIFDKNPVTKADWQRSDFTSTLWTINNKQITFGLNHQVKQNTDKIQVGTFKVYILYLDSTAPDVKLYINDIEKNPDEVSATWYNTDVNVAWVVSDPESGIDAARTDCVGGDVTSDTTGVSFTCTATNGVGLKTGPIPVTIKRDTVLPEVDIVEEDFTDQATTIAGLPVSFTLLAEDALSGLVSDPNCSREGSIVVSGGVQPIAQNAIVCTAEDNAGNTNSDTLNVNVLPYLDLGYVEEGVQSTITVSDPAASGTIQVPTTCDTSGTTNVALTETTTPGVFSAPIYTTLAPTGILNGIQNLECAGFDGINVDYTIGRGTSTDSGVVQPAGSGASLGGIRALQFNSDAVHLGNNIGMSAKRTIGSTGCTSATTIETLTVRVTSPSDPTTGIVVTLTEDTASSCIFRTTENIWFISGASATGPPPSIQTDVGQTVIGTLQNISPIEITTVLILPVAPSIPALGTPVTVSSTTCSSDTDNDGICNSPAWEGSGTPLTITGFGATWQYTAAAGGCPRLLDDRNPSDGYPTGTTPSNLATYNPVTCPSSTVKDIFYEIDYFPNHKPSYAALLNVINTFRNAPSSGCPSGTTCPGPINLHIKLDEVLPVHDPLIPWTTSGALTTANPMGGFDEIKRANFMSPSERTDPNAIPFLRSERQVMRYMLIAHQQEATTQLFSSGYSEIKGNDAMVTLGAFSLGVGNQMELEGTILHEMGHNINLNHGGAATNFQNCKTNHLSNMNYLFQFTNFVSGRPLDFSRVQLNNLNELSLIESAGIGATGTPISGGSYTTAFGPLPLRLVTLSPSATTPINWNYDIGGDTDTADTVQRSINNFDFPACNDDITTLPQPYDTLTGSHDWSKIDLKFRANSGFFADGIQALNPIDPTTGDFGGYENAFTNTGNGISPPVPVVTKTLNGVTTPVDQDPPSSLEFPTSVNEGDTFTLDLSESTDNSASGSPELYGWNFGDLREWDTPGEDVLGRSAIIFADDDDDETGDNIDDPDLAKFQIVDEDANRVIGDVLVTVNNVDPTVSSPATLTEITEGDTLNIDATQFTFTDPGINDIGNTASFDWGNGLSVGTISETAGTAPDLTNNIPRVDTIGTVGGSNQYLDDGTFSILLTVTDKDGGSGSSTSSLTVLNDPPVITDISSSAGTFTDRGVNDSHEATVTWGSGGATSIIFIPLGDRAFTIPPPPADAACGTQTATVVVSDDDTSSASASFDFISSFCSGFFSSPLTNAQFEITRTVPATLSLFDTDGITPMGSFVVEMFIVQNGFEQPVITSEGTNIAPYDSASGTYVLHVKLKSPNYEDPAPSIGQAQIIARVGSQTVPSGVFTIK